MLFRYYSVNSIVFLLAIADFGALKRLCDLVALKALRIGLI